MLIKNADRAVAKNLQALNFEDLKREPASQYVRLVRSPKLGILKLLLVTAPLPP
jgi:hypothetical protein